LIIGPGAVLGEGLSVAAAHGMIIYDPLFTSAAPIRNDRLLTLDRSQMKVAEELGVICLNPLQFGRLGG